MKMSRRARRMQRYQQKQRKQPALNLVSLMDIFTILVFFLLVSSSDSQQLQNNKDIRLPTSLAQKAPKETLVIMVTSNNILVQGRNVASIGTVMASSEGLIAGLKDELLFQASKRRLGLEKAKTEGRAVTIMGDESLPYELLRKILTTCREANYTQIAFAALREVSQK